MKTIEYKKIETNIKIRNTNIPVEMIFNWTGSLDELKVQLNELVNFIFDYKEILRNHIKGQKWAEKHLLVTGEDIQLAMDVHNALNSSMKVEVDDKVADYLCDAAASMAWTMGLSPKALPYASEFKEYFKKLKESKGKAVKNKGE